MKGKIEREIEEEKKIRSRTSYIHLYVERRKFKLRTLNDIR